MAVVGLLGFLFVGWVVLYFIFGNVMEPGTASIIATVIVVGGIIALAARFAVQSRNKEKNAANLQRSYAFAWNNVKEFAVIKAEGYCVGLMSPAKLGFGNIGYIGKEHTLVTAVAQLPGYMAVIKGKLNICPADNLVFKGSDRTLSAFVLPLSNIMYYGMEGQVHKYVTMSGGGTDYSGAIVGGLIGGDTGAILGSRQEIKSTVHTDDDRKICLYYKKDGRGVIIEFDPDDYDTLFELMPDKDIRFMNK